MAVKLYPKKMHLNLNCVIPLPLNLALDGFNTFGRGGGCFVLSLRLIFINFVSNNSEHVLYSGPRKMVFSEVLEFSTFPIFTVYLNCSFYKKYFDL